MPYYNRDPKTDPNFDNHPHVRIWEVRLEGSGFSGVGPEFLGHGLSLTNLVSVFRTENTDSDGWALRIRIECGGLRVFGFGGFRG